MSINYSRVPNNRGVWNNRGGGGLEISPKTNNRGGWNNWGGLKMTQFFFGTNVIKK